MKKKNEFFLDILNEPNVNVLFKTYLGNDDPLYERIINSKFMKTHSKILSLLSNEI